MVQTKTGALFAALLFLSACERVGFQMPKLPFVGASSAQTARAFLGQVKIAGPEGFCIAKDVSQLTKGFAVIVPCRVLGDDDPFPPHLAFITLQLGSGDSAGIAGSEDELREQIETSGLEDLLGDETVVEVLETDVGTGLVAVHYRMSNGDQISGLSSDVWRVFADVNDRLAVIALHGYAEAPLTVDDGRTLLYQTLNELRVINP